MKNLKNTQGSVWLAVLVIIAVVVAALLLSGNTGLFSKDNSIHGLVTEVNQEKSYFLLEEVLVTSVAEDGSAEIQETEYVVTWSGDRSIEPYHPSVLNGGEMVRVTPREPLEEGDFLIVDPESLEITRSSEELEEGGNQTAEPTSTTSTTTETE